MNPNEATVAVSVRDTQVAPCLPGVGLLVVPPNADPVGAVRIDTSPWPSGHWARRLYELDVNVLICVGIDRFVRGMMAGYGIEVVSGQSGTPAEVIERYRAGAVRADPADATVPLMRRGGPGGGRQARRGRGGGQGHIGMGSRGGGPGRGRGRRCGGPPWGDGPTPWSGGPR